MNRNVLDISGIPLEVFESGSGAPLLLLHGASGFRPDLPMNAPLSAQHRLICPSHPGFGKSGLPDWLDRVDDIAVVHLELLDRLNISQVNVIGFSIGGWITAEMASMAPDRFRRIALVGPVGIKTGPIDRLDIPDIFALSEEKVDQLLYQDPARMKPDPKSMSDEDLFISFRNRETVALLAWEPYMHNPKLRHRLHRVSAPTLFVRGESDGIVSEEYLRNYAALLPNSQVITIPGAGHLPHLEQPARLAEAALSFFEH